MVVSIGGGRDEEKLKRREEGRGENQVGGKAVVVWCRVGMYSIVVRV